MVQEITIEHFFKIYTPLIDVRSPGEYEKGHIPGAVNIPLFLNAERAHIGTVYVRNSKEKATELAYRYVNPKLDDFITQSKKAAPDGKVVVHCWRGGMRSYLFARHLHDNGFAAVSVILGGYKAYRNYVLKSFNTPFDLKIVGGYTGSGKTYIIKQLQQFGLQVADLEELAKHKGSAFGHIGQPVQPTSEQFENNLFEIWRKLDLNRSIWLEDESRNIGGINIPIKLFEQMQNSPVYFLDIPKEERARHLVTEYADADPELLADSLRKIAKRLGGLNTKNALQFLKEKNYYEVAMLALHYYDKSYLKGMRYRNQEKIFNLKVKGTNSVENAKTILTILEKHEQNKTNPI